MCAQTEMEDARRAINQRDDGNQWWFVGCIVSRWINGFGMYGCSATHDQKFDRYDSTCRPWP